ncbi:MAG: hypothetical protein AAF962_10690 [Actinomycetota bacterium]
MERLSPSDLFVRGVWQIVPDTENLTWVDRAANLAASDEPLGDYGPLMRRFLEAGISHADIARFARIVGYQVAFGLCYYLGDPHQAYEGFDDEQDEVTWELFNTDPDTDEPRQPLPGIHESLLSADPTGSEMRPPTDIGRQQADE